MLLVLRKKQTCICALLYIPVWVRSPSIRSCSPPSLVPQPSHQLCHLGLPAALEASCIFPPWSLGSVYTAFSLTLLIGLLFFPQCSARCLSFDLPLGTIFLLLLGYLPPSSSWFRWPPLCSLRTGFRYFLSAFTRAQRSDCHGLRSG